MPEFIDPRDSVSYEFNLISEGTATNVWRSPDTDFVVIENTDSLIIPGEPEPVNVEGKGWYATQISNICFEYLREKNVPNHYLWANTGVDDKHTFAARPLRALPELVVRNQPLGSYLARHPDEDHTEAFPEPIVEFFEENSEFGSALLVVNHEQETVSRFRPDLPQSPESLIDERPIRELGHLMVHQWDAAAKIALKANLALKKAWELGDAKLIDISLQCGVDDQDQVILGGTIGPESWRLWLHGDPETPLDQQLFADSRRPSEIAETYAHILLETMQWLPRRGGGGNTGNFGPEPGGGGGNTGNP